MPTLIAHCLISDAPDIYGHSIPGHLHHDTLTLEGKMLRDRPKEPYDDEWLTLSQTSHFLAIAMNL